MIDEEIRIERIKVKDLVQFAKQTISSASYGQLIPITTQRAIAHSHNPYAESEDIGLLVAYSGNECVGYFGILPILLQHGSEYSKVYWFSTWLVSPKFRGKSIGSLLMEDALSLDKDYMIVGSGPARKVCQRFGFYEFEPLIYYYLDMSAMECLNPLTLVFRFLRKLLSSTAIHVNIPNDFTRFVDKLLSPLTKHYFYWISNNIGQEKLETYRYREVNEVNDHGLDLDANLGDVAFYRNTAVVNWMLRYPWVVEHGESLTEGLGYYFTDVRERFHNFAIELYVSDTQDFVGFITMSFSIISGIKVLKVIDIRIEKEGDIYCVFPLAIRYAKKFLADRIEIPESVAKTITSRTIKKLVLHEKHRIYQCHPRSEFSPLGIYWRDIELNYCDGDMAFT